MAGSKLARNGGKQEVEFEFEFNDELKDTSRIFIYKRD
jgi:hypothetical protein